MSDNSSGLFNDILQYLLTGGAGVVGRGMYHLHLIQKGERKPWWWTLCDMVIALIIGWTVLGLGDWISVPYKAVQSLAIIAGWGGPHLIDRLIEASIRKYLGDPGGNDGVDPSA